MEMTKERLRLLATAAVAAIFQRTTVSVTRAADCDREGFPLPIKRNKAPNVDGTITQEYRPMAILEYVEEACSGELASRLAKERAAQKAQTNADAKEAGK